MTNRDRDNHFLDDPSDEDYIPFQKIYFIRRNVQGKIYSYAQI